MKLKYRLKKAYRRIVFSLSSSENPLFLAYCKYIYKPKPGTIAVFLDKFSGGHKPVTFLQVGANDGFINDPLHLFIKRDDWNGVLLEPQPGVFNEYMSKLHRKRPGITALNAALDRVDGTRPIYKMAISSERWAHGLSSFSREVLEKKIDDGLPAEEKRAARVAWLNSQISRTIGSTSDLTESEASKIIDAARSGS